MTNNVVTHAMNQFLPQMKAKMEQDKKKRVGALLAQATSDPNATPIDQMQAVTEILGNEGFINEAFQVQQKKIQAEIKIDDYDRKLEDAREDDNQAQIYKLINTLAPRMKNTKDLLGFVNMLKPENAQALLTAIGNGQNIARMGNGNKLQLKLVDTGREGEKAFASWDPATDSMKILKKKDGSYWTKTDTALTESEWTSRQKQRTADQENLARTKSDIKMDEYWTKKGSEISEEFFDDYKKGINATRNESISNLTEIGSQLSKVTGNPATFGIVTSLIARQLGKEVGALSEGDLKRVNGNQSVPAIISRTFGKMLKGQALKPEDIEDFQEFVNNSMNIQKQLMLNDVEVFSYDQYVGSDGEIDHKFLRTRLAKQLDYTIEPDQDVEQRRAGMIGADSQTPETNPELERLKKLYKDKVGSEPTGKYLDALKKRAGL